MSKWALLEGRRCYALLIVTDGKLQVARNDTLLLVVTCSIAGELEDLGCEVLKDGGEVNWNLASVDVE